MSTTPELPRHEDPVPSESDLLPALSTEMGRLARLRVDDEASLKTIFRGINEAAVRLLGIERAAIWQLASDQFAHCSDRYDRESGRHEAGLRFPISKIGRPGSFLEGHVIAVTDLDNVPDRITGPARFFRAFGIRSCIVARIWVDGTIAGFLVLSYLTRLHEWGSGEIAVAESLAALAGKSLEAVARHETLRDLRRQQSRMLGFAEVSSDCFWETDAEHRFQFLSPGAEKAFGRSRAQLLGQSLPDSLAGTAEFAAGWRDLCAALSTRRTLHDIDLQLADSDNHERILRLNGVPVLAVDGEFVGYRGTAKDMTASFAGERRLQDHLAGVERLSMTDDDGRINLNHVFRETVKLASRSVSGIFPSIWLWDERRRMLNCAAFYDHIQDHYVDVGVVQFNRINPIIPLQSMQGVTVQQIGDVGRHAFLPQTMADLLDGFGVRALIDALLWREGECVGVMAIGHAEVGHEWSPTEKLIMESLANHVLRSLEAHELQVTRDSLRLSEERFRSFAEATSDWFWETGRDHRFTFISDHHREVTGLRTADVIGRTRWNLHGHEENDVNWRQHIATLCRHRPFRDFRCEVRRPDGTTRHISISGKPVFNERGEFLGYRGSGRDRTAEHEAEQDAIHDQNFYRAAIEESPNPVIICDANDIVAFRNRRYRANIDDRYGISTLGLSYEGLLNALLDVGHVPEAAGREEEWIRERMAHHRNPSKTLRSPRGETGEYTLEIHESPIEGGGMLLTFVDISEYRGDTEELELSAERYLDFAMTCCDWVWETDAQHRFTYIRWLSAPAQHLDSYDFIGKSRKDALKPDQSDFAWRRHAADLEAHRPFRDFRFRYVLPTGRRVKVSISGNPRFDAAGRFLGYRGTGREIKNTSGSARSRRETVQLLNRTLDQLPAGIAVVAGDNRIEYCNPRFRHFCHELLELDATSCRYDAVLEGLARRSRREMRQGVTGADIARNLRRQHAERRGHTRLAFSQGMIRFIDLVEFAAPGERALICLSDSTTETEQSLETDRSARLHMLCDPLTHIAMLLTQTVRLHGTDHPDAEDILGKAGVLAERLSLLSSTRRQHPKLIDLADWLELMLAQLRAGLPPELRLEIISDQHPVLCQVDPALLLVAVREVLRNAADACPADATVTLRLVGPSTDNGDFVRLSILDSGPGIPPELRDRALDPFVTVRDDGGVRGLGLPIVELFAHNAGGYVTVRNRAGGGTTVEIGLPASAEAVPRPEAAAD